MEKLLFLSGLNALNKNGLLRYYSDELRILQENFDLKYLDEYYKPEDLDLKELIQSEEIDIIVKDSTETSITHRPEIKDTCFIEEEIFEGKPFYTLTGTCLNFDKLFDRLGIK
ncbi:hypothetical protein [Fusobacterium varium]|uniref:hypothetical protein n=1 Tax=Fusobacterium varium TaxID=856 RepID=UPI0022E923DE|nr:hypothetical protein [Fusobacterium varium]